MQSVWDSKNLAEVLIYTSILSLCLGLMWLVLYMFFPYAAPVVALVGSALVLFILGEILILSNNLFWRKYEFCRYFVAILCFVLGIVMAVKLCLYLK